MGISICPRVETLRYEIGRADGTLEEFFEKIIRKDLLSASAIGTTELVAPDFNPGARQARGR